MFIETKINNKVKVKNLLVPTLSYGHWFDLYYDTWLSKQFYTSG
jgi:hypothetical protein